MSTKAKPSYLAQDRMPLLFPFLDLEAEFASMWDEVLAAVEGVFRRQQFIMGPEVAELEKQIATLVGSQFAIACASGTDALQLALMASHVGAGDEVIADGRPTFVATASSIARLQAKPVFVDIDPDTYTLDWRRIQAAITPYTKAIIPVHLFGLPADMSPIVEIARDHGLAVIEDAAQAIGARYGERPVGGIGSCGCFSFFPSKNLGGAGDGGCSRPTIPTWRSKPRFCGTMAAVPATLMNNSGSIAVSTLCRRPFCWSSCATSTSSRPLDAGTPSAIANYSAALACRNGFAGPRKTPPSSMCITSL